MASFYHLKPCSDKSVFAVVVVDILARGEKVNEGVEKGYKAKGVLVVRQAKLVKGNCQDYL